MGSDFGGDCGANAGGRRGFEEIWRQGRLNRVKILQVTTPDLPPNPEQAQPGEGPGLKQTLGLFSATAIVIGSMIGSGIYIVDADIARGVGSPALFLGAWLVTAVLTLIGALSYGELAAMMPKAGGQYIYLREALGPLWGFLFGWTLFLVIQTGTIAAVCVAFGKFLGVFFPSVSTTHWLWHIAHVPAIPVGPMVLGNMDIGLSTANLAAIVVVVLLAFVNIFGVGLGAAIQNIFTSAKAISLAALILLAFTVGRTAEAWNANFGAGFSEFWKNAGWSSLHQVQVGVGGPMVLVNLVVVLAVVQVGSLFSADAWNNITYTAGEVKNPKRNLPLSLILGTGFVLTVYFLVSVGYLLVLPMHGDPHGGTIAARGIQYAGAGFSFGRCVAYGRSHFDFDVWLRQRTDAGRCSRVLCDEPGRTVFQVGGQAASEVQNAGGGADDPGGVDSVSVRVWFVRTTAGLPDCRGAGVLHFDHREPVCTAGEAAECGAALQGMGLSGIAGALHRDGGVDLYRIIAIQAPVHVAGPGDCAARYPCISFLVTAAASDGTRRIQLKR
jgi:L-asparagine transporter-like permease